MHEPLQAKGGEPVVVLAFVASRSGHDRVRRILGYSFNQLGELRRS